MKLTDLLHLSQFQWPLVAVFAILGIHAASAQLALEFGDPVTLEPISNIQLQPNEVRSIAVLVENSGSTARLSGYTLELGIGGGGLPLGGTAGPVFTAADLVTGSPFASDHGTPTVNGGPNPFPGVGSVPQYLGLSLTTSSAAVPPEAVGAVNLGSGRSLLATLTVSASGFTIAQSWNLQFVGAGSSSFFNDANNNTITPGLQGSTISVVPEPEANAMAIALVLVGLALLRRGIQQSVRCSESGPQAR